MPMSLKEACKMFPGCAQKERLAFPCVCGQDCGGYCSISRDMSPAQRPALRGASNQCTRCMATTSCRRTTPR